MEQLTGTISSKAAAATQTHNEDPSASQEIANFFDSSAQESQAHLAPLLFFERHNYL